MFDRLTRAKFKARDAPTSDGNIIVKFNKSTRCVSTLNL